MTAVQAPAAGSARLRERFTEVFTPNYAPPPVALVRGQGCTVWDADGKAYLDLLAGIAVSSLGHAHPALVAAVSRQVGLIAHTSNLAVNTPSVDLAERLVGLLGDGGGRVFLCNDGATANEAAIKIALRAGEGRRGHFVAAEHGFHGRTLGALALTGKPSIREPFGRSALDVTFVPYGDTDALAAAVRTDTAAVVLEPTLGESGVVPPPAGYLPAAQRLAAAAGALFVMDEVQGGIGRTGTWFAHAHEDVTPDVITLAKGLGGGLPIGATLARGRAAHALRPGDHGSTFGGNPVAAAAALAVLDTIRETGMLASVTGVGDRLAGGIRDLAHPGVRAVRGRGLWLGIVLADPVSAAAERAARDAGFLVNAPVPDVLRLAPPLVLSAGEADRFVAALPAILAAAADG